MSALLASISPEAGLLWLLAAILLIAAAIGLVLGAPWWWYPALPGVLLSQGLIVTAWSDAKFGTLANVIITILYCSKIRMKARDCMFPPNRLVKKSSSKLA